MGWFFDRTILTHQLVCHCLIRWPRCCCSVIRPTAYYISPTAKGSSAAGGVGCSLGATTGTQSEHEFSAELPIAAGMPALQALASVRQLPSTSCPSCLTTATGLAPLSPESALTSVPRLVPPIHVSMFPL